MKFGTFLENCGEDERVLVFGTGHWYEDISAKDTNNWKYPKNAYLANNLSNDCLEEAMPDLLMSTEINKVPEEYVGKFNIVIFEGFESEKPDTAFHNTNKLLTNGGVILVFVPHDWQMEDMKILQSHLIKCGFSFLKCIEENFESEPEGQYIGKWVKLRGAFYWVWKKE
jgi:hypothetical protein